MAFGYSPVSGCFVVHVTHSPLERTAGHVGLVFHQWNVSPILCCLSSRESMVHLRRGLRPHARSGKPVLHLFIFIHSEAVPEPVRDPEFTRGPAGHGATVSRQPHCSCAQARTGSGGTRRPAAFCFLNRNFALRLFLYAFS